MLTMWEWDGAYGVYCWPVKVERRTDKSVWVNGRRHAIAPHGDGYGYADTFEEGKELAVACVERKRKHAARALALIETQLEKALALTKSDETD